MPFARIDDEYTRHPKLLRISPELRRDAIALEVAALGYCGRVLSDGYVPTQVTNSLGLEIGLERRDGDVDRKRLGAVLGALCSAGRWELADGGFQIHDYLHYNPSAEEIKEKRAYEAEKKRRQRAQKRLGVDLSPGDVPKGQEGGQSRSSPGDNGVENDDVPPSVPAGQPPMSPGDARAIARTRAGDRAGWARPPVAQSQSQSQRDLPADRSETTGGAGLPFEKELTVSKLLAAIGEHADEGTSGVVRHFAAQLPVGSLEKVLESTAASSAGNRAGYAVSALKGELERYEPEPILEPRREVG